MSIRFLLLTFTAVMISSCASLKPKGSSSFSDSKSPYVKQETAPKPKATSTASSNVVVREEKVKVVDSADGSVYNYYVIIGSFKILENAKNFRSQLTSEGFKPTLLENETGLFRVSVLSNNDEQVARNKISDIRNSYAQYSDVWLLVRKK